MLEKPHENKGGVMCCWLKPFFLTNIQSIAADIFSFFKKKNHSMLRSAPFFFFLIYSNATSVQSSPQKFPNMCFFCCIVSMWFVFLFLMFFVLLFAQTFDTEPLLVLRGRRKDPDTQPERRREKEFK